MEAVAEMTRFNFEEVYNMSAMEFFAYCSYLKYKQKKEEDRIRQFKAQHR